MKYRGRRCRNIGDTRQSWCDTGRACRKRWGLSRNGENVRLSECAKRRRSDLVSSIFWTTIVELELLGTIHLSFRRIGRNVA